MSKSQPAKVSGWLHCSVKAWMAKSSDNFPFADASRSATERASETIAQDLQCWSGGICCIVIGAFGMSSNVLKAAFISSFKSCALPCPLAGTPSSNSSSGSAESSRGRMPVGLEIHFPTVANFLWEVRQSSDSGDEEAAIDEDEDGLVDRPRPPVLGSLMSEEFMFWRVGQAHFENSFGEGCEAPKGEMTGPATKKKDCYEYGFSR
mmetsp:Transcript_26793/g.58265  ORF Transcript_26793/g.58265 Transcript_26793/m.58265 type:complete len:206 (+) Transcript_26793:523-1140(+)